jgi:hypothetical protein
LLLRPHLKNLGASASLFIFNLLFFCGCSLFKPAASSFESDTYIGSLTADRSFGHFKNAQAISIDGLGDIYVVDADAPGVYKFSAAGDSIRSAIGVGSKHGEFDLPVDIDASLTNSIAIADRNNHRIELYSRDLIWQATIEGHLPGSEIKFGFPASVRAGSSGYYYVIDNEATRLLAINPSRGTQQTITTSNIAGSTTINPQSVVIDPSEYITVADVTSHSLLQFNNAFAVAKQFGYPSVSEIRLSSSGDDLFVTNPALNTIRVFDSHSLSYRGSYSLPPQAAKPVMVISTDTIFYVLTKENVIVCSISSKH